MKKIIILLIAFMSGALYADEITQLAKEYMPGVVTVYTEKGLGSGFIIDSEGYLFTNAHVISKLWSEDEDIDDPLKAFHEHVTIAFNDKQRYPAKIIGYDARVDIALLKIEMEKDRKYKILKLGDSDKIIVGEKIVALGSPLGLEQTITAGVVSHVGRELSAGPGWEFPMNVIQTDAAINPGNSGGPMLNMQGKVIGINYASASKWASEGVGFSIPINIAKYIKEQLIKSGKVHHGYIGIDLHQLSEEYSKLFNIKNGILVDTVDENSPAGIAGIKSGDILIKFNNKDISATNERQVNDFIWEIAKISNDININLTLLRQKDLTLTNWDTLNFMIKVRESPPAEVELKSYIYKDLGFSVKEITDSIYFKYNLSVKKGLWINKIDALPAVKAGLSVGDVIININTMTVITPDDLNKSLILNLKQQKRQIPLKIQRRKDVIQLFIEPQYNLKNKKLVLLKLNGNPTTKLLEILEMKLLTNGIMLDEIDLKELKTRNSIINEFDGLMLLSGTTNEIKLTAETESSVKQYIDYAVKEKKMIAAAGPAVLTLIKLFSGIKTKKITCNPQDIETIKQSGIANITGNDVETDDNIVTATGTKKSYYPFTFEIINMLGRQ